MRKLKPSQKTNDATLDLDHPDNNHHQSMFKLVRNLILQYKIEFSNQIRPLLACN